MFAYGFEEAQIAGLQPSLLINKLRVSAKTISLLCLKIRILPNGCWEWMGARRKSHGAVRVRALSAQVIQAHRLTYELVNGVIGPDLDIHHKVETGCIGPSCVNPDHLVTVTRAEHIRDLTPGSASYENSRKETCPVGHPFSGDNLRTLPNGARQCRACDRIKAQNKRDRLRTRPKFAKDPEKFKTKCFRDHDLTDESNIRWVDSKTGKQRVCLACEEIRLAAYKVGKKAAPLPTDKCKRGHPMEGDNVYLHPDGVRRSCRACRDLNFKKRVGDMPDDDAFVIQDFSTEDDEWV